MESCGVACKRELSAAEPIAADTDLLHRAVSNLIANGIEAMPNGGTLIARTRIDDTSARIEIADTGSGLSREAVEHLFTP